ncbi:MAG: stage II sporulation protein M [Myxococcales bacterium]|nr:stage II sporulation protein M [Myxococcales bacterium]
MAFRKEREGQWFELDRLTDKALRQGLKSLDAAELHRLPVLYRACIASLSVARRTAMDQTLIAYLEALAGRAYLAVYGSRRSTRGALRRALFEEFPRRVRALGGELALSTGLLTLGAVVAWTLMNLEPGWYDAFVNPALAGGRDPYASTETLRSALYDGADHGEALGVFASFLFVHNARIGLMCFALGFAAGIPTAILLFTNGLMLGAFLHLYHSRGLLFELVGWLLPHGVPEIGAVILCGAAGLHIGRAMLLPGRRKVRDSLARAGRHSAIVVAGAVVLFAIAGLVEGIFRQAVTDDTARYALAGFNLLWFFAWLFVAGRAGARRGVEARGVEARGVELRGAGVRDA